MALCVQCDKCDKYAEDMHAVQLGYGMAKGGMAKMGGAHICNSCWPQWKADFDKLTEFFSMETQGPKPDLSLPNVPIPQRMN